MTGKEGGGEQVGGSPTPKENVDLESPLFLERRKSCREKKKDISKYLTYVDSQFKIKQVFCRSIKH